MATTTSVTDNSFLSRCTQDLNPDLVSYYSTQSTCATIAGFVTMVAFTALAVTAFAYATLYFPLHAPIVALGALILASPASSFSKFFLEFSVSANNEADNHRNLQAHFQRLSQQTPGQICSSLAARGIDWLQIPGMSNAAPQNIARLNPILARATFLDDAFHDELRLKRDLTAEAKNLAKTDFTANRQKIYELRHAALFAEDRALNKKVEAAFANAVLRSGDTQKSLTDVAALTGVTYPERMLGSALNDNTGLSNFLVFKNRQLAPLTYNEVKNSSVGQLGQRLFAAMN